ncbi:recombinase family protein [Silvibacterium bohemicum]|uniref:recombinase family protein n=1 Tax=Silvibacterium bohemicum TaxID=1577686 RepID=UPI0035D3E86B
MPEQCSRNSLVERYVIYARYSMAGQNALSIEDQFRVCRKFAQTRGWIEVGVYSDKASSGAGADRKDYQELLRAISSPNCPFTVVLVDDTSRAGRDLEETLRLHNLLRFHGIRLIAISQGIDSTSKQSKLLITVHGLVDEIYWQEIGLKTHRGLLGCVERGTSTGGRCYGYNAGKIWTVNPEEAKIVIEIFTMSANGYSLKRIVAVLNSRALPPPRGRKNNTINSWAPTCIREMLRNEIYIGRRKWNQKMYIKRPGTNKRVARAREEGDWIWKDCPEFRIVSDELWARVQQRQRILKERYAKSGRVSRGAHSAHLLSGLLICSECGGQLIVISGTGKYTTYGCSRAFNRAVCSNRAKIKEAHLEGKLFAQLHTAFNTSEVFDSLVESLIQFQMELLAGTKSAKRIQEIETQLRNLIGELAQIGGSQALRAAIREREEELRGLQALKSNRKELSPAEIAKKVQEALQDIPALFKVDPLLAKAKLAEHLDRITMCPQPDGTYLVEGEWDLLGAAFAPQMVAGVGFEPTTFGL